MADEVPRVPDGLLPLLWAEGWIYPPSVRAAALRDRLGELEQWVLDGRATREEIAEYRRLQRSHAAWLRVWDKALGALAEGDLPYRMTEADDGPPIVLHGRREAAARALEALTRAGIVLAVAGAPGEDGPGSASWPSGTTG